MKWNLGLNNTVSRLIPTFIRSPRMFHWVASLGYPLDYINKQFIVFADVKKREAQLSSQTQLLQDYLNVTFKPLLPNPTTDFIQIVHGLETSQATFYSTESPPANAPYASGHMIVYGRNETPTGGRESPFIYFDYEDFGVLPESFRLILPASINGNDKLVRRIESIINKYTIDTNRYDTVYS